MASQAPAGTSFDIGRILQRGFKTLGRQAIVFTLLAFLLVGFPNFILQSYVSGQAESQPLAAILSPLYWISMLLALSGSFLLQDMDKLDLNWDPRLLAAHAIVEAPGERAVKGLMQRLEGRLVKELGREAAAQAMAEMKREAADLVKPETKSDSEPPESPPSAPAELPRGTPAGTPG